MALANNLALASKTENTYAQDSIPRYTSQKNHFAGSQETCIKMFKVASFLPANKNKLRAG